MVPFISTILTCVALLSVATATSSVTAPRLNETGNITRFGNDTSVAFHASKDDIPFEDNELLQPCDALYIWNLGVFHIKGQYYHKLDEEPLYWLVCFVRNLGDRIKLTSKDIKVMQCLNFRHNQIKKKCISTVGNNAPQEPCNFDRYAENGGRVHNLANDLASIKPQSHAWIPDHVRPALDVAIASLEGQWVSASGNAGVWVGIVNKEYTKKRKKGAWSYLVRFTGGKKC